MIGPLQGIRMNRANTRFVPLQEQIPSTNNGENRDEEHSMYIDRLLRLIAGAFILLSLLLAVKVNINWLWFTAFVGLNLLQSGFTDWCPMMTILEKLGVPKQPDKTEAR